MDIRLDRKQEKRDIRFYFLLCVLFSVAGVVTGVLVILKSSDADIDAFISALHFGYTSFSGSFWMLFSRELMFLGLTLFLGYFSFGWIAFAPLYFYGCLGFGAAFCCLCLRYGWFGALYSAAAIAVPAACVIFSRSMAGGQAMRLSFRLFDCVRGKDDPGDTKWKPIIMIIPCAAVAALACALRSVMRTIYFGYID